MRFSETPKAGGFCAQREHCSEVRRTKDVSKVRPGQDPQETQEPSDHKEPWAFFLRTKDSSIQRQQPAALHCEGL